MSKPRYAVIRDEGEPFYRFSKWHELESEAVEEAVRLARKENSTFVVIKEVAKYSIEKIPIKVERME